MNAAAGLSGRGTEVTQATQQRCDPAATCWSNRETHGGHEPIFIKRLQVTFWTVTHIWK